MGSTVSVHVYWSGRGAHQGELGHVAHRGGQGRVLERHPHAPVGSVGAGAPLPLVALDGGLEVVRVGEVVELTLQRIQVLGVPRIVHYI